MRKLIFLLVNHEWKVVLYEEFIGSIGVYKYEFKDDVIYYLDDCIRHGKIQNKKDIFGRIQFCYESV